MSSGSLVERHSRDERKSLQTDRVILVPGPESEVDMVRSIYGAFVEES